MHQNLYKSDVSKSPKCFGLPGVPSSRSPVSNPQNVPLYGKRVGTVTHLHTHSSPR